MHQLKGISYYQENIHRMQDIYCLTFGMYFKFMNTFLIPFHKQTALTHTHFIHNFIIINWYITKHIKKSCPLTKY